MKWSWGTSITVVYTTFALATLSFVAFAMTQRVDLVRTDYYEESLQHDAMQIARKRAIEHGTTVLCIHDTLRLAGESAGMGNSIVDIEWQRNQNPDMDERKSMRLSDLQQRGVSVRHMARGTWNVRLRWKQANDVYQIDTLLKL